MGVDAGGHRQRQDRGEQQAAEGDEDRQDAAGLRLRRGLRRIEQAPRKPIGVAHRIGQHDQGDALRRHQREMRAEAAGAPVVPPDLARADP